MAMGSARDPLGKLKVDPSFSDPKSLGNTYEGVPALAFWRALILASTTSTGRLGQKIPSKPKTQMHLIWRDRSGDPPNWAAFLSTNLKRGPVKAYTQQKRSENPPKSSFSLAFPFPVWLSPKTNKPNQNKQNTQHKHLNTQINRHADKQNKHCFKSRVYFPVQNSKFPRHNFRHRHHTHTHTRVRLAQPSPPVISASLPGPPYVSAPAPQLPDKSRPNPPMAAFLWREPRPTGKPGRWSTS